MAEEGDPFGGLTQDELNALMEADARQRWANQPRGLPRQQANPQPARQRQAAPRPASQPQGTMPMYDHGMNMALGGFNAAMMGAQEGNNNLQGMAGDVMSAFQNENESRVAQERERRRMEYQKWLAEQQLYLQWGKLDNEREMQKDQAANQIRMLKAQMAMREDSQPSAWKMDSRSGQMMPMNVIKAAPPRRRSFQTDPLTGERRWMEDWEL